MKTNKSLLFAIAFFAAIVISANAFSFVPMSASLTPSGANSVMSFKVTNDTTQSIAVVIKVMTRTILLDGTEKMIRSGLNSLSSQHGWLSSPIPSRP